MKYLVKIEAEFEFPDDTEFILHPDMADERLILPKVLNSLVDFELGYLVRSEGAKVWEEAPNEVIEFMNQALQYVTYEMKIPKKKYRM